MNPASGKVLDSDDAVFDLTAFLKTLSAALSGAGIKVNTELTLDGAEVSINNLRVGSTDGGTTMKFLKTEADGTVNVVGTVTVSGVATEATLALVKTAVESIAAKDFATQTTLALMKTALDSIDAGTPAALGQATMANSMPVVIASDQFNVEAAGADAVSNTQNNLTVTSRLKGFNGTSWDRIKAGITAVTATLTGFLNTLPWAVFHTTPSTRTDGQGGPLEADASGNLQINLNKQLSGENQAKNRLMVTRPGVFTRIITATTTTPVSGTGILARIIVEVALTGTLTVYDNTAASGTILTILPIGTPAGSYQFDASFTTGCTAVTSAADRVVLVTDLN